MAMNGLLIRPPSSENFLESLSMMGLTILNIITTYPKARIKVNNAAPKSPAFAMAITTARMHQAVTSSVAAQVIAMTPKGVRLSPLS